LTDNACGIARDDQAGRDVTNDYRTCTQNREISYADVRPDECVGAQPGTPPDPYCALDEWQVRPPIVMRSGAKMCPLGYGHLCADGDLPKIVDLYAISNRRLVSN
jgi:hypothetical protein